MFTSLSTHPSKLQDLNLMIMFTLRRSFNVFAILISLLLLASQSVYAEQKESFGNYEVHYSAFASTFLTPEVAKQYDIVRSRAVGVINISVLKKTDSGSFEPVAAHVEGVMANDIQQQKHLGFRRIKEGKAIYFISEVQYMEGEVLSFNISATPEGQQQPLKMRFSQTFYNEKK
ncbi:DUF4426 domain-containing protein [Alkalimarinus alittae]|uniref:DUF4426 domain-containing protein n=1 Tax=Alkalimarinus alittae TaxID=2961619 RepID=A0ABY6N1G7_9ALTE|nr:DUF4426 domain-containing protein [Alkalimarinus alittae]UZE95945.1 DUF4426 domain-containing protein [Alkalimarinus alittae]